ncbi:MAG: hypothetical protein QOE55_126 [Acidobacteriaceae bacterium]|nr:hypothetical protein [Acidobacteriaceae bacterium]
MRFCFRLVLFVPESDISVYSALISGVAMLLGVVYFARRRRNAVVDLAVGAALGLASAPGRPLLVLRSAEAFLARSSTR